MDIVIKDLHLNVHIHKTDDGTNKIISEINKLSIQMAETKAELLALITTTADKLTEIGSSVGNISQDVTELIDKVTNGTTPEGGLSPADTAEVKTALQGIADSTATAATNIKAVADKYQNAGEQPPTP